MLHVRKIVVAGLACLTYSCLTLAEVAKDSLCQNASTLFINANFITLNPNQPRATTVAVTNHRIVAVGEQKKLMATCRSKNTQVVDLKGAVVTPGFIDTHSQFLLYGWLTDHAIDLSTTNALQQPDWQPIKTTAAFLAAIKNKLNINDEWLVINGYDQMRMQGEPLTQAMLNEISTTTPIIVFFSSGHQALLNQAAVKKTPSLTNTIGKDGIIRNEALHNLLVQLIKQEQMTESIQKAGKRYSQHGYTTVTEAQAHPDWLNSYEQVTKQDDFPVDIIVNPTNIAEKQRIDLIYQDNPRLYPGPVSIQVDGAANEYRAFLNHSYLNSNAGWHGTLNYSPRELETILMAAGQAKTPIALECDGDAAIDLVLNITSKVQRFYTNTLFHPVIVNAQFVRQDQLERMRQLGVSVNWFVPHLYYWGEAICQRVPNPKGIYKDTPLASAKRTFGTISAHAHSPTTAPNPLQMMQFMNTRQIQSWGGSPPTKECINQFAAKEQVDLKEALKALTIDAALLYGLDKDKGSIESGKLADMTILSANPLQSKNLQTIQILGTIVRGVLHLQSSVPSMKTSKTTRHNQRSI